MLNNTYLYKITPKKPDFVNTITEEESKVMGEHFMYLKKLMDENRLMLAGPCTDGAFGIAIYYASTLEEAKDMLNNDPAVKAGVVTGEVHEFRISLLKVK